MLWISLGTGFISGVYLLHYLQDSFLIGWCKNIAESCNFWYITSKSDLSSSYFFEKLSNFSVSSLSQSAIPENFTSSFMSSSLLRFSFWLLCKNHFCKDIKRFRKIIKELRAKNNFKDSDGRKQCLLFGDHTDYFKCFKKLKFH